MTNIIITQNNFNGDWRFIPNKNGTKSQLILSKNILTKNGTNENVSYNFNYDVKDHVIGRPTSLMNQLLGLDENQFYKCIIDNNSLTFIVMTQSEINDYNKSNEDKKNKEKDENIKYQIFTNKDDAKKFCKYKLNYNININNIHNLYI